MKTYSNLTGISDKFLQEIAICYLDKTNLMKSKNGKLDANSNFDKEMAKTIYRNHSAIYKNITGKDPWFETIGKAVDKCEFSKNLTTMRVNIANFYNCTTQYLLNNCEAVEASDECDETLKIFEECKKIVPNCNEWPRDVMLPEFCCIHPEMITNELRIGCRTECSNSKNEARREAAMCVGKCLAKKIRKDEKIDFDLVKALLKSNAKNKNVGWDKIIDSSVESCKLVLQGDKGFQII